MQSLKGLNRGFKFVRNWVVLTHWLIHHGLAGTSEANSMKFSQ